MKSLSSSPTLLAILLSSLLNTAAASCAHNTFLHKRVVQTRSEPCTNETVKTVAVGKFGYIGAVGPTNWHSLSPDNMACATSTQQSPIDITAKSASVVKAGEVKLSVPFLRGGAEFENLGTTVEVVLEGEGGVLTTPGGKEFELKQFHFHSPSEHTLNGEYYPLEMHMVTQAKDKSLAVVSVLFSLSSLSYTLSTPLLLSLRPSLFAISKPGSITTTSSLNFTTLISSLSSQPLHSYNGSLTTPPCAEGLQFFITSRPLELDSLTFNAFKKVLGFNSRFSQGVIGEPNLLSEMTGVVGKSGNGTRKVTANAPRVVEISKEDGEVMFDEVS